MKVSKTKSLKGKIEIPSSKSHTLRALIFATIAEGKSIIKNPLSSPDADSCAKACQILGAKISRKGKAWVVEGTAGNLKIPKEEINVGNSGITLRFIAGVASNCKGKLVMTGDASIQSNRPMQTMIQALSNLGVKVSSLKNNGYAPISIQGPLKGGFTTVEGHDSQPVSGLLIGSLLAEKDTEVKVVNAGEKPWVGMTLHWFDMLGLKYANKDYEHYKVQARQKIKSFSKYVPGDFSSAAFPLAAAIITPESKLEILGLDMADCQGDKELVNVLKKMGAKIEVKKESIIAKSSILKGIEVNVNDFIDAVPILAVIGCFAEGKTVIKNAEIAKHKESNRLAVMESELRKMGASISQTSDGLIIKKSRLRGAAVDSHNDHRVAMALAVAGLAAEGETTINNTECIKKTFGNFSQVMRKAGAKIR